MLQKLGLFMPLLSHLAYPPSCHLLKQLGLFMPWIIPLFTPLLMKMFLIWLSPRFHLLQQLGLRIPLPSISTYTLGAICC